MLAGIGDRVFNRPDPADTARIIAGVEGTADESDKTARLFGHYAHQSNNDLVAMAAVLKRPARDPFTPEQIQKVSNEVLVVIGDHDSAGPSDMLATSFPSGKLKVIRNVDHFATTDAFAFIDAMLEFIEGN